MRILSTIIFLSFFSILFPINVLAQSPEPISFSPDNNDLNISATANISVVFNMDIEESTLNESSFIVHASRTGLHAGVIDYDPITYSAVFIPTDNFAFGEVVTVTLTTNIESTLGNPLSRFYYSSFTIEANGGYNNFSLHSYYTAGDYPNFICAADLDNDNDLDLATSQWISTNISVLLNNGDGTFSPSVNYAVTGKGHDIIAADFDSDNHIDLAVSNHHSASVSVLLNNGDGTFATNSVYSTGSMPTSITYSDFDGDSDLDMATANYGSGDVTVLLNNGDAEFTIDTAYSIGGNARSVYAADLNNDGYPDMVGGSQALDNVTVLINNGDGTFNIDSSYAAGNGPTEVNAVDLDNDSDLDIALGHIFSDSVSILLNNGDGSFGDYYGYPTGDYPYDVEAADFDGDGDLDLITSNIDSDNVTVLINNGDATFETNNFYTGYGPNSVVAVDLDGDEDIDLATANGFSDNISVLFNNSQNSLSANFALYFDGDDQSLIPHIDDINFSSNSQFTIEFWFMRTNPRVPYHFVAKRQDCSIADNNYQCAGDDIQLLNFESGGDVLHTGIDPQIDEWTHMAVTYDNTLLTIYLNGVLQASTPFNVGGENTCPLKFGAAGTSCPSSGRLIGFMDEVRFWNIARDSNQISAYYNRSVHPNDQGLIGYWNFNEEYIEQTIYDSSPQQNNGTLGSSLSVEGDDPTRMVSSAPIIVSEHDAAIVSILSPDSIVYHLTEVIPSALVRNLGLVEDTIPVSCKMGENYIIDTSVVLPAGDSTTVVFPIWEANEIGTLPIQCYSSLLTDSFSVNDTISSTIVVVEDSLAPYIYDVTPNAGGNGGNVTVSITGSKFQEGAVVKLTRADSLEIVADSSQTFSNDSSSISAVLNLDGAVLGFWDVMVINPDGKEALYQNGFQIEATLEQFWVDIIGRDVMRVGRWQRMYLECMNAGNVDIPYLLVSLKTPGISDVVFKFTNLEPPPYDYMDWSQVDQSWESDSGRVANFIITGLNVGSVSNLEFLVYSDAPGDFSISVSALKADSAIIILFEQAVAEIARLNILDHPEYADTLISLASDSLVWWNFFHEGLDFLGFQEGHKLSREYLRYTHPITIGRDAYGFGSVLRLWLENPVFPYGSPEEVLWCIGMSGYPLLYSLIQSHCNGALTNFCGWDGSCDPTDHDSILREMHRRFTVDPEDKYGPNGFDFSETSSDSLSRFVSNTRETYSYRIDFWNHEDATADAQIVMIRDTLDDDFDLNTFGFAEFGFLDNVVKLEGVQSFDHNVDMRPDKDLIVNVEGTLDSENRAIEWIFTSLVPGSDTLPDLIGFLPPMSDSGFEMGWVDFSVDPLPGLPTGTKITNLCYSNFDWQPPCDTCPLWTSAPKNGPWTNTIDAGPPQSAIIELPDTTFSSLIYVEWFGYDEDTLELGAGIKSYSVYYDTDSSGIYTLWLEDTGTTSAEFIGEHGYTYDFYCFATDNVGHVEEQPTEYQARTLVWAPWTCGDADDNSAVNILDITFLISYLYKGGPSPEYPVACDVNSSGTPEEPQINILDITYLINYLYKGGSEPICGAFEKQYASKKSVQECSVSCNYNNGISSITINSPVDLYGIEMILKADSPLVSIQPAIENIDLFYHQAGSDINLGLLDPKGKHFIKKGEQSILTVMSEVLIDSILASDANAKPVTFKIENILLPKEYSLSQNYPNPFNPITVINFALPQASEVNIEVFNILGRRVTTLIDRHMEAGYHSVKWDGVNSEGTSVATGVYFYRIQAGDFTKSKKMVLLK